MNPFEFFLVYPQFFSPDNVQNWGIEDLWKMAGGLVGCYRRKCEPGKCLVSSTEVDFPSPSRKDWQEKLMMILANHAGIKINTEGELEIPMRLKVSQPLAGEKKYFFPATYLSLGVGYLRLKIAPNFPDSLVLCEHDGEGLWSIEPICDDGESIFFDLYLGSHYFLLEKNEQKIRLYSLVPIFFLGDRPYLSLDVLYANGDSVDDVILNLVAQMSHIKKEVD